MVAKLTAIVYPVCSVIITLFGLFACIVMFVRQRRNNRKDSTEFFLTARRSVVSAAIPQCARVALCPAGVAPRDSFYQGPETQPCLLCCRAGASSDGPSLLRPWDPGPCSALVVMATMPGHWAWPSTLFHQVGLHTTDALPSPPVTPSSRALAVHTPGMLQH